MYTDYTQVSIYTLLFPTRRSTSPDCWNMMKIEGARKAPPRPCKHWMGRTAISWSVLHSLWLYYFLQPYTVATQEERWAPITSIVNAYPVIWAVARAIQGTLPSAASPQNPLCRTQHFKRQPGWAKACSWRTRNEQFKTNSFRMSSSKFIYTSQAHQLKRNIHVYVGNTLKHTASMCLVALRLKWCNISAALKIVFMGHVEPNLTVRF